MNVDYALLADGADVPAGGKLYVMGGGIDAIIAQSWPWRVQRLALVVRLELHPTECDTPHQLIIRFWDEHGKELANLSGPFQIPRNPLDPSRSSFVHMVINFDAVEFAGPGDFEFLISVDGTHRKTLGLLVIDAARLPGATPP